MAEPFDMFAFETPDEAQARILQEFTSANRASAAAASDPAQVWGIGMANLFGPAIQKQRETKEDRKAYVKTLMSEGLSKEAAEAQAKVDIEPGYRAVRQAEQVQSLSGDAFDMMQELTPELGIDRAQAVSMLNVAARLRQLGMGSEAMELSKQASTLLTEAAKAEADLESVKARTRASNASANKSEAEIGSVGKTDFMKVVASAEQLRSTAESAETPEARESALRQLGMMEGKIAHDIHIAPTVGRTEFDMAGDKPFVRKQMTEVFNDQELNAQLGLARDVLVGTTAFDASLMAQAGARTLGFMESWFGREPSETQKAFMDRVTTARAVGPFVARQVRHAQTGSQMSEFEIKYLDPFLPSPSDSKTVQLGKLAAVQKYTQLSVDTRMALLQDPGGLKAFFDTQEQMVKPFTEPKPSTPTPAPQQETDDAFLSRILQR